MSYLYYNKGVMVFIKNDNAYQDLDCIEISKEKEIEILNKKNNGYFVKVLNNEVVFIKDFSIKRKDIVNFKNQKLSETDYLVSDQGARDYLELTTDDINDLNEYRDRLRRMDDHFDDSDDKDSWEYVFVDVYTSGKNTNSYQLVKPSFVK